MAGWICTPSRSSLPYHFHHFACSVRERFSIGFTSLCITMCMHGICIRRRVFCCVYFYFCCCCCCWFYSINFSLRQPFEKIFHGMALLRVSQVKLCWSSFCQVFAFCTFWTCGCHIKYFNSGSPRLCIYEQCLCCIINKTWVHTGVGAKKEKKIQSRNERSQRELICQRPTRIKILCSTPFHLPFVLHPQCLFSSPLPSVFRWRIGQHLVRII